MALITGKNAQTIRLTAEAGAVVVEAEAATEKITTRAEASVEVAGETAVSAATTAETATAGDVGAKGIITTAIENFMLWSKREPTICQKRTLAMMIAAATKACQD